MSRPLLVVIAAVIVIAVGVVWTYSPNLIELMATREQKLLRQTDAALPFASDEEPALLVLAIDGVDRDLLYELLNAGELPAFARLLGGKQGERWPHAHFERKLLAAMPTSTLAAWATIFTGEPPARHGVAGNEYFIREQRRMAAPAPVSISNPDPVMATYTDGYANDLLEVPTIYERLARRDRSLTMWVSMSQFYEGANRLLLANRTVVAEAFQALLSGVFEDDHLELYRALDEEVVDTLVDALEEERAPHVITLYLCGTDHYAHVHAAGPDRARRDYLREALDPLLAEVHEALQANDSLEHRHVLVTSDHGHTGVIHDRAHALSTDDADDPPGVLLQAGFRLRPFELEVDSDDDFQAVLAYGGALAYVYLADRSTCPDEGSACDWSKPPRFEEDVLAAAEAFYRANESGEHVPKMRGTLDLILARRPRAHAEDDLPFEVYVGGGQLVPLGRYLAEHPRPSYVAFEERLRDLAVGPFGERAGDVLLLANNGNVEAPEQRYYFAGLYHSWHGSPSRADSEVPLILANPSRSSAELARIARATLGDSPRHRHIAGLIERLLLRGDEPAP